ncbi:MAG: addiction module protein [Gammaproteobacteria bacterium]
MSNNVVELERKALNLPPQERERLALAVWESLEGISAVDPEGVEIALRRNEEIESGLAQPIDHDEFMRRTSGNE